MVAKQPGNWTLGGGQSKQLPPPAPRYPEHLLQGMVLLGDESIPQTVTPTCSSSQGRLGFVFCTTDPKRDFTGEPSHLSHHSQGMPGAQQLLPRP